MAIHILNQGVNQGISSIPYAVTLLKLLALSGVVFVLKRFFGGARNTSERNMHSKVVMMTVSRRISIFASPY